MDEQPVSDNNDKNLKADNGIISDVAAKINEAHNILVALSSDPSVDEMAAAIGLTLFLDKLGKRTTAIYSGTTPNALEFLKPEDTFESTADTLQDFVIALNKEKADHLRYKLDGDFVKIYITPYRTRIAEEDLDFSYGDFNVDLVLALDVANGIDLDSALREHGRIMHDAVVVNITTGNPGKFGEIEWSDKNASSVSEMITKLLYSMDGDVKLEKDEATAFLTGIVAATDRFSNANTTPETMLVSSQLMESGANQQLISKNITPELENEMMEILRKPKESSEEKAEEEPKEIEEETKEEAKEEDHTKLDIKHDEEEPAALIDDLKAAEASLAQTGAETTPESPREPLKIESTEETTPEPIVQPASVEAPEKTIEPISIKTPEPIIQPTVAETPEKVIQPSADSSFSSPEDPNKYGKMLEEALATSSPAPATDQAIVSPESPAPVAGNPAAVNTPSVPAAPEINGVPEINYMPMPGEELLPPPPTPPIMPDLPAAEQPAPIAPTEPTPVSAPTPVEPSPAPVAPAPAAPAPNPSPDAFKIPGM